jgi:bifunctional non-homologous end joining protein LigD
VYKAGRPNSGGTQIKFKFKGSATVRCKSLNEKHSFVMEMLSKGDWIEVGNCTYFESKYIPTPGCYCEIAYLYAFPEGSLFQPTLKELRTDVNEDDCLVSQLKYKQGSIEDDEV